MKWTLLYGLLEIVGIISAAHAVMSVRTPQGTIAWAVSLVVAPFLSVPAYWVFGRNKFKGYIRARQHKLERLADTIRQANEQMAAASTVSQADPGTIAAIEKLARVPFTGGNRVDLLRYQSGFLHGKFLLIGHTLAAVGTANFDNRSFRLNFEITAVVSDAVFAGEVRDMFERDFQNSRLMVPGELDARPFWFRLAVRVTRLLAPLL